MTNFLRTLGLILFVTAMVLTFCLVPRESVHAQNAGNTGTFTNAVVAFTSKNTTGPSVIFPNIGQGAHYLSYCSTGIGGSATIVMEESFDGSTNWTTIASATVFEPGGNGCKMLQAGGYYQNVRANILTDSGVTISATYSSSSGPIGFSATGVGSSGPLPPFVCDNQVSISVASGTDGDLVETQLNPNARIRVCSYSISFNGATAAGSVQFETSTLTACGGTLIAVWPITTTANTPQIVQLGSGQGALFSAFDGLAYQNLCFKNSSSATARVNISYTITSL
jgi:hypothetical protein